MEDTLSPFLVIVKTLCDTSINISHYLTHCSDEGEALSVVMAYLGKPDEDVERQYTVKLARSETTEEGRTLYCL